MMKNKVAHGCTLCSNQQGKLNLSRTGCISSQDSSITDQAVAERKTIVTTIPKDEDEHRTPIAIAKKCRHENSKIWISFNPKVRCEALHKVGVASIFWSFTKVQFILDCEVHLVLSPRLDPRSWYHPWLRLWTLSGRWPLPGLPSSIHLLRRKTPLHSVHSDHCSPMFATISTMGDGVTIELPLFSALLRHPQTSSNIKVQAASSEDELLPELHMSCTVSVAQPRSAQCHENTRHFAVPAWVVHDLSRDKPAVCLASFPYYLS